MNLIRITFIILLFSLPFVSIGQDNEQTDIQGITETLNHYIEGTANGEPERLALAFHPDFNLYSVSDTDSLKIWEGSDYVSRIKPGQKSTRVGRIISIDYENNAASAKVEIVIPDFKIFTDYFLLLKYQGSWKIIHKSYTSRPIPGKE